MAVVVELRQPVGDGEELQPAVTLEQLLLQVDDPFGGADARHQLGILEGLGDVVVRAEVEALDLVLLRSEEHTSELQSLTNLVCRLLLEKKKNTVRRATMPSTWSASRASTTRAKRVYT